MRIETWNLKEGDEVIVHTEDDLIYIVEITQGPFEVGERLFIKWIGRSSQQRYYPLDTFRGRAEFDDKTDIWKLNGRAILKIFNKDVNL